MKKNSRSSRPPRGTMAGMIYDANESLNWIMNNDEITEVFRSSRVVGSHVYNSKSFSSKTKSKHSVEKNDVNSQFEIDDNSSNGKSETIVSLNNNNSSGSLAQLFSDDEERDLLGIAFFTIWEAGVVVSGYHGKGIVLSRNIMNGEWSGPVAVGLAGVGAGLLLGASVRTIVYLIYDYFTLESIIGTDGGVIFGLGAGATIGTWTKETAKQSAYITSPKMLRTAGIGSNVALCRGLAGIYGNVSVEAGFCKTRDRINAQFYGRENLTGSEVLLSGETIEIPNSSRDKKSHVNGDTSNYYAKRLMEKVHMKLKRLCFRDDPQLIKVVRNNSSDRSAEEVQGTLEELYADESFDDDDYEMTIKGNLGSNNETGIEHMVTLKGDEVNGDSTVSPTKSASNEDDLSEEMAATQTTIILN